MSDIKDRVRASLERQGFLRSKEEEEAAREMQNALALILQNPRIVRLSALVMFMNTQVIIQAMPDDADELWASLALNTIIAEIDRRFPVLP